MSDYVEIDPEIGAELEQRAVSLGYQDITELLKAIARGEVKILSEVEPHLAKVAS